ncbi:MAG: peptide ABC transporter substrate-binding protein [Chloroflexi bacterium]|nr:peptide ABC transporter substrate-binding protein [Chloroflexota bacterium]
MGAIRLQVAIAILAIALLIAVMGYLAFQVTTVIVPAVGGTYIEGVVGNPRTINPVLCHTNPVDQDLCALLFTGLTRANEKGEIVPDLAERWDISDNGTAYTFYLRPDVLWHDGAPFTADDVVFTVNTMQNPGFQGVPYLSELWRTVVVERVDTYTVRFILREPFAPFLDYTTVGILPVHILGSTPVEALAESQFSAVPVGTGPLQVAEVSARRILLVANPHFYRSQPYIERVEFRFYPDEAAVFAARSRGEVDGIAHVLPEYLRQVGQDDGLTLYSAPLSGYNLVYLNLDRGIFQDRAVRQAMLWALDREKLVDEILDGQGVVLHSPILPHSWAYDPDVPKYGYDLRKAKTVLEEAGWFDDDGDGVRERGPLKLEFTLVTNEDDPLRVRLIYAISEQWAAAGIHAIPQTVSWEKLVGQMLRLRRYDAALGSWQNLPPDPDLYPYWHSSQVSEDGLNFANYMSEQADRLLEDGRSTHHREERIELYRRFQELFAQDVPSILLYQPVYNYAVESEVRGIQVGPMIDSSDRFRTFSGWYIATQRMLYSEARQKGLMRPR